MNHIAGRVGLQELQVVGLSEVELAIYGALVDTTGATVAELGRVTAEPSALAPALRNLEVRGLINKAPSHPDRYTAVDPELALELLLLHREEELKRAQLAATHLAERFHQARAGQDPADLIEVIAGASAVSQRSGFIQRSAREQLRVTARPPFAQSLEEIRAVTAHVHKRNVRVRNIVDARCFEFPWALSLIRDDLAHGEEYRALPDVPLKLIIADDRAALIPLKIRSKGIHSAVLVHSSALLDALIAVFETLWQQAAPLDVLSNDHYADASAAPISDEERQLLALLAAGSRDATIGRQLGVSPSTVQRRIHALMARLDAATRFQAGLQAALRGWIRPHQD